MTDNAEGSLTVFSDFPSGNIVLERIEGDDVYVHQDLRDTNIWWFYWHFGVRGAAGRRLTFHFTNRDVFGARGPAGSLDGGKTWAWLGLDGVRDCDFTLDLPPDCEDARFCFGIPYTQADFDRFLQPRLGGPHIALETLCQSRHGRAVEMVRLGCLDRTPQLRLLLVCRHHSCEMMASDALEGYIDEVLDGAEEGEWLRRNVETLIVPFVDKDGVEEGDQGKCREPRDHNRDYDGEGLYPETRALRKLVPEWSGGLLRTALDLHCPYIKGGRNEKLYFVGMPEQEQWEALQRFSAVLAELSTEGIPYSPDSNLPHGEEWNTDENHDEGKSFGRWVRELPGVHLGAGLELPYANAGGVDVTPASARMFGRDLARSLARYLPDLWPRTTC